MSEVIIPAMTREQLLAYFDGVIGELQSELTTLRSRTEWHTGFPEQNGIYVVKVEEEPDQIKIATYIKELGWMNRYYDDVIRWAYLPQEEK